MKIHNTFNIQPPSQKKIHLHKKINKLRLDTRKNQRRLQIRNKRLLHGKNNTNPILITKMGHLNDNPQRTELINKMNVWQRLPPNKTKLDEFLVSLYSEDVFQQHYGMIGVRKIVCHFKEPAVQMIVDRNVLDRLFFFAASKTQTHLKLESVWIFANIAGGPSEQVDLLSAGP